MKRYKILICWIKRHHWLFVDKLPTCTANKYMYYYQCQRCGSWDNSLVTDVERTRRERLRELSDHWEDL